MGNKNKIKNHPQFGLYGLVLLTSFLAATTKKSQPPCSTHSIQSHPNRTQYFIYTSTFNYPIPFQYFFLILFSNFIFAFIDVTVAKPMKLIFFSFFFCCFVFLRVLFITDNVDHSGIAEKEFYLSILVDLFVVYHFIGFRLKFVTVKFNFLGESETCENENLKTVTKPYKIEKK